MLVYPDTEALTDSAPDVFPEVMWSEPGDVLLQNAQMSDHYLPLLSMSHPYAHSE